MHKKELRSKYKSLRASLSENEIEEKSLAIANKLSYFFTNTRAKRSGHGSYFTFACRKRQGDCSV